MLRTCTFLTVLLAGFVACGAPAHAEGWRSESGSWSGAGSGWNGGGWTGTGNRWDEETAATVELSRLDLDRPAISPNGDGSGDVAKVSLRLRKRSAHVTASVVDAAGATVGTLGTVTVAKVDAELQWDGRDANGAVVPDGAYRIVLRAVDETAAAQARASGRSIDSATEELSLDIAVDSTMPGLTAKRPRLAQLKALAKRAAQLRDAKRRWQRAQRRDWNRGHGRHGSRGWSSTDREWIRFWEARQLRLPVSMTTTEDGVVSVTAQVGGRTTSVETWRPAGTASVDVALPKYAGGQKARITMATEDEAGNLRRHTVVVTLPKLPAPPKRKGRDEGGDKGSPTGSTPPVNLPTDSKGPFPDWLDPIMLRATYGAGVPQSWAKSTALAKLVQHESSFNPKAQNPTSTAYGLFQFLDQTWAGVGCTKTSDAYQQSVCGLRYIQRRYRTPERAWAFWQAQSPHWY